MELCYLQYKIILIVNYLILNEVNHLKRFLLKVRNDVELDHEYNNL